MRNGDTAAGLATRGPRQVAPGLAAQFATSTQASAISSGLVSAAASAAVSAGSRLEFVPVHAVTPHPENARVDLGDLTDLVESIREVGVLSPLLVDEASSVRLERSDLADQLDGATFVLRAGERRLRAARLAGMDEVPVMVKPTADRLETYVTFFHENVHRKNLSALEEARVVVHLRDVGQSQSAIATRLKISEATVSRRLKLLTMPNDVQMAVHEGRITATEATQVLGRIPRDRLADAWTLFLSGHALVDAVREVQRGLALEEATASVRSKARARGEVVIDHVDSLPDECRNRLDSEDDVAIEAARSAGSLVVHPTAWGPAYFDTRPASQLPRSNTPPTESAAPREHSPIPPDDTPTKSAAHVEPAGTTATGRHEPSSKSALGPAVDTEAKTALKARRAAAALMVQAPPSPAEAVRDLTRFALVARGDHSRALGLAFSWLREHIPSGLAGRELLDDADQWERQILNCDREPQRVWLAWTLAIAHDELRATRAGEPWDRSTRAYFEVLLNRGGYEPTPWELARLQNVV